MDSRPGRRGLLVALLAAATVAVFGVLLSGPFRVGPSSPGAVALPTVTPPPAATVQPGPSRLTGAAARADGAVQLVALIVLSLVTIAVLAALVLWLARRAQRSRIAVERPVEDDAASPAAGRPADPTLAAPEVRRGLARALDLLDEPVTPSDAVVRAWLGLEDAAVAAGAPRRPAETPSEYAARIIRRFDADREAADELRRLYERVRFGGVALGPDAVEAARGCLTRLLASWARSGRPLADVP